MPTLEARVSRDHPPPLCIAQRLTATFKGFVGFRTAYFRDEAVLFSPATVSAFRLRHCSVAPGAVPRQRRSASPVTAPVLASLCCHWYGYARASDDVAPADGIAGWSDAGLFEP